MTFALDFDRQTVLAHDDDGAQTDINAGGAPCTTLDDLRELVDQLCDQGAFDLRTSTDLLAQIDRGEKAS